MGNDVTESQYEEPEIFVPRPFLKSRELYEENLVSEYRIYSKRLYSYTNQRTKKGSDILTL